MDAHYYSEERDNYQKMKSETNRSAAVILAAGIGSRMSEVTDRTSKCIVDLDGITPLEHTIKSFVDNGVNNVFIVVGHYHDKVIESVKCSVTSRGLDVKLEFVINDKYNYHGCEYSLSCASSRFSMYDTVYITEGDLLLAKAYVSEIIHSCEENAALIRDTNFIDRTRSVVAIDDSDEAIESGNSITSLVYEPDHTDVYKLVPKSSCIRGESIQLWKFSGDQLKCLTSMLMAYNSEIRLSKVPVNHSGLLTINKVIAKNPLAGIMVDGHEWLNLNTIDDVKRAKSLSWLNK